MPFENVRLPIKKGYIELPKFAKSTPFSTAYNHRDYREDGENRSVGGVAYGPPILPPVTIPNTIDSVNPYNRQKFPYNPPTSSTVIPGIGYNTFDPHSAYDPTTTRSVPKTRGKKVPSHHYTSDYEPGLPPGP